jgi:hypothetical protein
MPDMIEYEMMDCKPLGATGVKFQLEDGTIVEFEIEINRIGRAINEKNPDGTAQYVVNASTKMRVLYKDKKFFLPRQDASPTFQPPKGSHIA